MIAIIDYGAGNIFSVKNALDYLGLENKLVSDAESVKAADAVILPGVGAFPAAMEKLNNTGLVDTIKEEAAKKPFLGICLGMQLIFEKGYEFEECDGLGLIKGSVRKMEAPELIDCPSTTSSIPTSPSIGALTLRLSTRWRMSCILRDIELRSLSICTT